MLAKEYKITGKLGSGNDLITKGAFAKVISAVHIQSGLQRAIKIVRKSDTTKKEQEILINEVNILKKLDHPNIIKIYEFAQNDKNFYIVTELCTGGDLFDRISKDKFFGEDKAAMTIKQVLSAIFYCHSANIMHRDMKPENIIYANKDPNSLIKVIDFGTSKAFNPNKKIKQKIGTVIYN